MSDEEKYLIDVLSVSIEQLIFVLRKYCSKYAIKSDQGEIYNDNDLQKLAVKD